MREGVGRIICVGKRGWGGSLKNMWVRIIRGIDIEEIGG